MDKSRVEILDSLNNTYEFKCYKEELANKIEEIRSQIHRNLRKGNNDQNVLLEGKIIGLETALNFCENSVSRNKSILNLLKGMAGGRNG